MYDARTQLRHTENRFELIESNQVVYTEQYRRTPEMRNYSINQLSKMLEQAGFMDIQAKSGFSDEPASQHDEVFCISGRKPQV